MVLIVVGVVKIPFINETILLSALDYISKTQTGAQLDRELMINKVGKDHTYGRVENTTHISSEQRSQ